MVWLFVLALLPAPCALAVVLNQRRSPELPASDPFEVLALQQRLGALADELRELESGQAPDASWARAHRIHTRRCAYDELLTQACVLAGVPGPRRPVTADQRTPAAPLAPGTGRLTEAERLRDELELASRGWSW